MIETGTNAVVGEPIPVGDGPLGVAITRTVTAPTSPTSSAIRYR
ncbi:hypothetical protein [Prescottella equi]|nr:hypothetical protein [Prescottella equi]